jgi:hypothetical protein
METPKRNSESENGKITNKYSLKDLMGKEAANDPSQQKPDMQEFFEALASGEAIEDGPRINPQTKQPYTEQELEKVRTLLLPRKKKKYTDEELDAENPLIGMSLRKWFKKNKKSKQK